MVDQLATIVTLLIALSVATERVVEIIKSVIPRLDMADPDPKREGLRRAMLHLLAMVGGVAIATGSWPIVSEVIGRKSEFPHIPTTLALGLLASGGSGFWNSILSYVVSMKDLKRAESRERVGLPPLEFLPQPAEGQLVS